jgi:ubiquinone/menaquinone biosynthesis C-methylase UbiE
LKIIKKGKNERVNKLNQNWNMINKNIPNIKNNKDPSLEKMERKANIILNSLGFKSFDELKNKKILDIGSGDADLALIAKNNGIDIVCSDIDNEKFQKGVELGLDYKWFSGYNIHAESESFDLVLSSGSVPMISWKRSEVIDLLKEVKRVLKVGGEFRFGPGCLIASVTDSNLNPAERNAIWQPNKDAKAKRRKLSLEILHSYDPNIVETLISLRTKYPSVYYTMKKDK